MKAIETYYKGYRFRSRTEARWAVFFDKLGLRWDYEEEGYVLPKTGCYLPDFKVILPSDEIIYCEVNHSEADDFADDEIRKLREFAHERRCKVILLTGVPDFRAYNQLVCRIRSRTVSRQLSFRTTSHTSALQTHTGFKPYSWTATQVACTSKPTNGGSAKLLDRACSMPLPLLALLDSSMENPPTSCERPSPLLPPPGSTRQVHLFNECRISEIVVSHLLIPRLLVVLTNRQNQNALPLRADQLDGGVCSIEQRQHGGHHEQEKSRGLGRALLLLDHNRPSHLRVHAPEIPISAGSTHCNCELLIRVECGRFLKLLLDAHDSVRFFVPIDPGHFLSRLHG